MSKTLKLYMYTVSAALLIVSSTRSLSLLDVYYVFTSIMIRAAVTLISLCRNQI